MRKALGAIVCLSLLTGCGAGEIAEKATGFHVTTIKNVFAPGFACDEVKGALDKGGVEAHDYYRVTCLPRSRFVVKMAQACEAGADVGKTYWLAVKGHVGYLDCKELEEEVTHGESVDELREDLRKYQQHP